MGAINSPRALSVLTNVLPKLGVDVRHQNQTSEAQNFQTKNPSHKGRVKPWCHPNSPYEVDSTQQHMAFVQARTKRSVADALGFDNGTLSGQSY